MSVGRISGISRLLLSLGFAAAVLYPGHRAASQPIAGALRAELKTARAGADLSVIIHLQDKIDIWSLLQGLPRGKRAGAAAGALRTHADLKQSYLKRFLEQRGARVRPLWIINALAVTAGPAAIQEAALVPGIERIELDAVMEAPSLPAAAAGQPEWNIAGINAPQVWSRGYLGQGVVVAILDTGVDVNHVDLAGKWRGGAGAWFDPYGRHAAPYDANGHGTQALSIILGGESTGSATGVAPGAQWIAAKIFDDSGSSTLSAIHRSFQWALDPDGDTGTDDAPSVVSSSWGMTQHAGMCMTEFWQDVQVLKAAGIGVVFSAGNSGPADGSNLSPANYPESFSVGAVGDTGTIASFSSRGPSKCGGSVFPRVAAPGVNVKAADLTFGGLFPAASTYVSGTSFASAHLAGGMALLFSAAPDASISRIEAALENSALDLGPPGPDNDYGYGFADLAAALELVLPLNPCADSDGDGFSGAPGCGTPVDCDNNNPAVFPGAPEALRDGIDQDCNGYDLTIEIKHAFYSSRTKLLRIDATSDLGETALLEAAGLGPMRWNGRGRLWQLGVRPITSNPLTVRILGPEGGVTAYVSEAPR